MNRIKPIPLDPVRPLPFGLSFYVLTARFNREYSVAHWIEESDIGFSLIPLETRWKLLGKQRGGYRETRKSFQVPLFPKLVIVGFSEPPNWFRLVESNQNVTGYLGINGIPAQMRSGEAERLRQTSEALRQIKEPKRLVAGSKAVLIAPGLFQNHCVEIKSLTGKKARIIQRWFGSERETEVAIEDLEAA